jgi:hypothetical protein
VYLLLYTQLEVKFNIHKDSILSIPFHNLKFRALQVLLILVALKYRSYTGRCYGIVVNYLTDCLRCDKLHYVMLIVLTDGSGIQYDDKHVSIKSIQIHQSIYCIFHKSMYIDIESGLSELRTLEYIFDSRM